LIYALIRGGEKICNILDEPMIGDIASASNLDENGIAHMNLPPADAPSDKDKEKNGVKKFVNKIGKIMSSVVKSDRHRDAHLPRLDRTTAQLPLVYIPLLIKRGIKWIERTSRDPASAKGSKLFKKEKKKSDSLSDKHLSSGSDKHQSGKKAQSPSPPAASAAPSDTTTSDEEASDRVQPRSAQEAVNELINWIDSESQIIYSEDEEGGAKADDKAKADDGSRQAKVPPPEASASAGLAADLAPEAVKIILPEEQKSNVILTYEEGPNPQEFFVPYLWSVVLRSTPEIPLSIYQTSTVDVVAAGLVESMLIVAEEKKKPGRAPSSGAAAGDKSAPIK
jgi:hypothetical protein